MAGFLRRPRPAAVWTVLVALAALTVLFVLAVASFSTLELRRFARAEARGNVFVYNAGQRLAPGVNIQLVDLSGVLGRLGYVEVKTAPQAPGQFRRVPAGWDFMLRGAMGRATPGPGGEFTLRSMARASRVSCATGGPSIESNGG